MEDELKEGFASSKWRENYLGILGYSVFGSLSGFENQPIDLTIVSDSDWPIFTTLNPLNRSKGELNISVADYNFG